MKERRYPIPKVENSSGQAMPESALVITLVVVVVLIALRLLYQTFTTWQWFCQSWDRIPIP